MKLQLKLFVICAILFWTSISYLQIQVARIELESGLKGKEEKCITKSDDQQIFKEQKQEKQKQKKKKKHKSDDDDDDDDEDQDQEIDDDDIDENRNYQQICYEKDISYAWPLYYDHQLYLMSLDTTIPISWIKGKKCHLEGSSKKCTFVKDTLKAQIKSHFSSSHKSSKHSKTDYSIIDGSSELVKGIYQTTKQILFKTRDTSRLANFFELMALGFYMAQQNQTLKLQNTTFINATQISKNLNYMADGGISLRFDQNSENSFLKQLFNYQNNIGKVITVWIKEHKGVITIGDASTKYSQNGYGGIQWVKIAQDDKYGKVPTITDVFIDSPNEQNFVQIHDKQYPAILTLSASYIGIPESLMLSWKKKLSKKAGCQLNEDTKHLQCKKLKEQDLNKVLTFVIDDKKISFALKDLVLGKQNSKIVLNLKQSPHETYAILGEPVFQKYLVLFDYGNNKIGFSNKRDKVKELINPVSLIRFICFVFTFGCSFIICFTPIKRCFEVIRSKGKYQALGSQETRRLKTHGPIQQNPYQELNNQIDDALRQ